MKERFVTAQDGVRLALNHWEGGASKGVVILAPGFFNSKDAFVFKRMSAMLFRLRAFDVIACDFRGHGRSGGRFTWTRNEPADLKAVVDYAAACGYTKIMVIGFSLGAASALLAAAEDKRIAAVVAVSAPYDIMAIDFHFWEPDMWEDLKLNCGPIAKGKGARVGWPLGLKRPVDVVADVSPARIVFVYGQKDWLIKPHHGRRLFEAAKPPKQWVLWQDAGHAERIFLKHPKDFLRLCLNTWHQSDPDAVNNIATAQGVC